MDLQRNEGFDELDGMLDQSWSRRDTIKRLAALGLVAAGGLAPLAAEAKPKRGGKKRRHGGGQGDGPGAQLDVPDPVIEPLPGLQLLTIGALSNQDLRKVYVYGTIRFDAELLALMQGGRQFRLTCRLFPDDKNEALVFLPDRTGFVNVWGGAGATASAPFRFDDKVARRRLDEDAPSRVDPSGTDEIYAKLFLDTRRTSAQQWSRVTLANGLDFYKTNQVAMVM